VASASTDLTGLAGRYATALFDLAVEEKALDAVAADLAALEAALEESPDLVRLVRSPVLSRAEQRRAMAAVLEAAGAAPLTAKFIGVLAEHRRLFVLGAIIAAFDARLATHRGEVRAEVAAPSALTKTQRTRIRAALKKAVGGKVAVEETVDESLLGGLVVRVGSRMVDASLRTKLQRLHLAMKGVG